MRTLCLDIKEDEDCVSQVLARTTLPAVANVIFRQVHPCPLDKIFTVAGLTIAIMCSRIISRMHPSATLYDLIINDGRDSYSKMMWTSWIYRSQYGARPSFIYFVQHAHVVVRVLRIVASIRHWSVRLSIISVCVRVRRLCSHLLSSSSHSFIIYLFLIHLLMPLLVFNR